MLVLAKKSPMTIVNNAAKAAEGLSPRFLSRRDNTIVARHEVPGILGLQPEEAQGLLRELHSLVGKGNRVRARGRGRGRFRKDCEVGEAVFSFGSRFVGINRFVEF